MKIIKLSNIDEVQTEGPNDAPFQNQNKKEVWIFVTKHNLTFFLEIYFQVLSFII